MAPDDAARDGKAEPRAPGLRAPRCLETDERLEHPLEFRFRYARPLVLDVDANLGVVRHDPDLRPDPVPAGVLQQVTERAAKRHRPAGHQDPVTVRHRDFMPEIREVRGYAVDQRMKVHRAGAFPLHVLSDECERILRHTLHLVQGGNDPRPGLLVIDHLRVQAQARDRGSEVVGNRREHRGTVAYEAVEPFAHDIEGVHCVPGFQGAGFGQVLHRLAAAELPGRGGQPAQGFRDPAPRQYRHDGDAERGQHERQHERPAPGRRPRWRTDLDVQPAHVIQRRGGREPQGPAVPRAVIVIPIVMAILVLFPVIPVILIILIIPVIPVIVMPMPAPHRRHHHPVPVRLKRHGEPGGDGVGPHPGSVAADQGGVRQRIPREIGAGRDNDGPVKRRRRIPQEPRHGGCAEDDIVLVRMAHRLDAFPGEKDHGNALGDGQGDQQQQREPSCQAFRRQPHPRSTLPVNR